MNSAVSAQMERVSAGLYSALLVAIALVLVKLVLSLVLRRRLGPGLAPGLDVGRVSAFVNRALHGVGLLGTVPRTMGMTRLRIAPGLRLLAWAILGLVVYLHRQMQVPAFGMESLLVGLALLGTVHLTLYEIRHDRADVILPRWWFGHSTHRWRDLVAVIDRDPFFVTLHFTDGRHVRVHKFIVGQAEFMAVAGAAIRNI